MGTGAEVAAPAAAGAKGAGAIAATEVGAGLAAAEIGGGLAAAEIGGGLAAAEIGAGLTAAEMGGLYAADVAASGALMGGATGLGVIEPIEGLINATNAGMSGTEAVTAMQVAGNPGVYTPLEMGINSVVSVAKDIYGNPIGKEVVNQAGKAAFNGLMADEPRAQTGMRGAGNSSAQNSGNSSAQNSGNSSAQNSDNFNAQLAGLIAAANVAASKNGSETGMGANATYGASQAVPLNQTAQPAYLSGSRGGGNPAGVTASMERAAPNGAAVFGTPSAPQVPASDRNQSGAVKLNNPRRMYA